MVNKNAFTKSLTEKIYSIMCKHDMMKDITIDEETKIVKEIENIIRDELN